VATADLNGDGHHDLAVTNPSYQDETVSVLLSNGDGTFQAAVAYDTVTRPRALAIATWPTEHLSLTGVGAFPTSRPDLHTQPTGIRTFRWRCQWRETTSSPWKPMT
jgi:hypothetical protein